MGDGEGTTWRREADGVEAVDTLASGGRKAEAAAAVWTTEKEGEL